MSLARFLTSLLAGGRVTVSKVVGNNGALLPISPEEAEEAALVLTDFESQYRDDLSGHPPRLSMRSMIWAASTVYRASSFLTFRDVNTETIAAAFRDTCPEQSSADVCYSADLTMRFLPDLIRLARAASSDDPLVEHLKKLACEWPLSSVGVKDLGELSELTFLDNRCLKQMYVDRIIAARDRSRLMNPVVAEAIRAAIGLHRELVPEFMESVQS
jgi:hypothetical protein